MVKIWQLTLFILINVFLHLSNGVKQRRGMSYEDMVINYVLDIYKMRTTHARPVLHFNDTLTVHFAIQLQQIMSLNEQDQVLTLNIWDQMWWIDAKIRWNPNDYGGVNTVRVPCDKIWTPDIKLHNYADLRLQEHREALCILDYNGSVFHMPQVIYRSSCEINVYTFPFDVQFCHLKFGSWTYDGLAVDLIFYENKNYIDLKEYIESSAWEILDVSALRNELKYTCCPEKWVQLEYYIVFKRRSALYNYILILPCVLLTSITLILFFIPPESPSKMQLGLAVFIAFFILLRLLEKNLPPGTQYMPLLGTYYCLNMVLITLSSFLNVLIVDLTTHGTRAHSPPKLGRFLFYYIAPCLLMNDLVSSFKTDKGKKSRTPKDGDLGEMEENKWKHEAEASNEAIATLQREQANLPGTIGILADIEYKLSELREFMRFQKQRLKERDQKENIAKQWKAVALLLDRVFFIVYLLVIASSLSYTLPVLTSQGHPINTPLLRLAGLKSLQNVTG